MPLRTRLPGGLPLLIGALRRTRDKATGSLREASGTEVLRFPGSDRLAAASFGPIRQNCTLDGVLIHVGAPTTLCPSTLMTAAPSAGATRLANWHDVSRHTFMASA